MDRREARDRLRLAAQRLADDAGVLVTAPLAARQAGFEARVDDLRRAVVGAELAGIPLEEIITDSGLDAAGVELLTAIHRMRHRRGGTHDTALSNER